MIKLPKLTKKQLLVIIVSLLTIIAIILAILIIMDKKKDDASKQQASIIEEQKEKGVPEDAKKEEVTEEEVIKEEKKEETKTTEKASNAKKPADTSTTPTPPPPSEVIEKQKVTSLYKDVFSGKFLMWVDSSMNINGTKYFIGTILKGTVKSGDTLSKTTVCPGEAPITSRVIRIIKQGKILEQAGVGEEVGISVTNTAIVSNKGLIGTVVPTSYQVKAKLYVLTEAEGNTSIISLNDNHSWAILFPDIDTNGLFQNVGTIRITSPIQSGMSQDVVIEKYSSAAGGGLAAVGQRFALVNMNNKAHTIGVITEVVSCK